MKQQYNNRQNNSSNYNSRPHFKPLTIGQKIYINATHPNTGRVYLCMGRVVRQARAHDDRYKILITGVNSADHPSTVEVLLGKRFARRANAIFLENEVSRFSGDSQAASRWHQIPVDKVDALVRLTVHNIEKDVLLKRKHQLIPRLD